MESQGRGRLIVEEILNHNVLVIVWHATEEYEANSNSQQQLVVKGLDVQPCSIPLASDLPRAFGLLGPGAFLALGCVSRAEKMGLPLSQQLLIFVCGAFRCSELAKHQIRYDLQVQM